MTVRYSLAAPLAPARPIGQDCEITRLGVRYDTDASPPIYQPLIQARTRTAGNTESPAGTIVFRVRFSDGTLAERVSEGQVIDNTPFTGNPLQQNNDWYEWDNGTGNFVRMTSVPATDAVTAIDSGEGISIRSAKTPVAVNFRWR